MNELKFETGLVTYSLNGKCEVSFNPGDGEFVERFCDCFEKIEKIQKEYNEKAAPMDAGKELFNLARERDAELRKTIDNLFSAPVCTSVFGDMSMCALADGFPVWLNLMLAITDEIEKNVGEAQQRADPRIEKYTAKYKNFGSKYRK